MSHEHIPEFEDRLRALLARTAEAIPSDTDLSPRVRQALTRGSHGVRFARGGVGPRPVLATIAAALVVALLAGVLTYLRPGGLLAPAGVGGSTTSTPGTAPTRAITPLACGPNGLANPVPAATPVDHSVAVGRQASLHGVTITIDRAYADATQTIITYHMQTTVNPPLPESPVLLDAQGQRYTGILGGWDMDRGGYVIFAPLPPEMLGTPQTLTFLTQRMREADPAALGAVVDGPWQISFSLTPVAGTSAALGNTPVTRNGLTVQPLRLDVALPGGGLDGASGGAALVIRLSGLTPGMKLSDLLSFDTALRLGGRGGSSSCGGGILELVLPDGQQVAPGTVRLLNQPASLSSAEQDIPAAQTVGPSGTVDLEALFYTSIPAHASLTLYMNHVTAQLGGAATPTPIEGPWQFQLQPSA